MTAFAAMDVDIDIDMGLDLNIDLGMDIDFDDEALTGVQTAAVAVAAENDVDCKADATSKAVDVDMNSSATLEFMDDVDMNELLNYQSGAVAINECNGQFTHGNGQDTDPLSFSAYQADDGNHNILSMGQQAGPVDPMFADVDIDQALREVNAASNDIANNFDLTALPTDATINDFSIFTNDNNASLMQNSVNAIDDIFSTSLGDENFLSSLNVTELDPTSLLFSTQLAQPMLGDPSGAIFPSFNDAQTHQVGIIQPASAALSDKSKSSTSSSSKSQKSPEARCHNFTAERPKYDMRHPWVRVNDTTKGKNNRSGKINQYNPIALYKVKAEPLKNWRSGSHRFRYNADGELAESTYSADQIRSYLYDYPASKTDRKLKLWIQRAPADSARRYANPESSKCRFRDCPSRRMMNGTIMHGHFRVAFDERWNRYGDTVDPFAAVSGYAHLYCMERFLDFAAVCAQLDVEVDTRSLPKEPRNRWAASLARVPECDTARCFIKRCRSGQLEPDFPSYPLHEEGSLAGKQHERTLAFAMHNARFKTLRPKRLREVQSEAPKASNLYIHFGDVERFCIGKLAERKGQNQVSRSYQRSNQREQSQPVSHVPSHAVNQESSSSVPAHSSGYTYSSAATQTTAAPLDMAALPRPCLSSAAATAATPGLPFLPNTRTTNNGTAIKDAAMQTDVSHALPAQHHHHQQQQQPKPTINSSPFPILFPAHPTNPAVHPTAPAQPAQSAQSARIDNSHLKRKRDTHRPEPIRTTLNQTNASHVSKRPRSDDGHGPSVAHSGGSEPLRSLRPLRSLVAYSDSDGSASRLGGGGGGASLSAWTAGVDADADARVDADAVAKAGVDARVNMDMDMDVDEPLSALVRGLLDGFGDEEEEEEEEKDAGVVGGLDSAGSLFG